MRYRKRNIACLESMWNGHFENKLNVLPTLELISKTMESKKVPGLYFIGEVVDVTGQLGGFNFQWAWAAGYSAGQYV